MNFTILPQEKIVERAKAVEAGKTAEWMLRIYDAADSNDETALATFRDEYIATRQAAMRFSHKGEKEGEQDGTAETDEINAAETDSQDVEPSVKLSKGKREEIEAAKVRAEKLILATEEADDLIAFALQRRIEAASGMFEEEYDLREDLEALVDEGVQAKKDMVESIGIFAFKESMKMTRKAARVGMSQIDVVQEGNLGAIRAVEKFDHTKGITLAHYSTLWVKQFIDKAIAAADPIRKPQKVAEMSSKIYRKEQELRAGLQPGEELSEEMIADALDISVEDLAKHREWEQSTVSLDKHVGDGGDDDVTLGDYQYDEDDSFEEEFAELDRQIRLQIAIEDAIATAIEDKTVQTVLRARFGIGEKDGKPVPRDVLAKKLGISDTWVDKLKGKGLALIRKDEDLMQLLGGLR